MLQDGTEPSLSSTQLGSESKVPPLGITLKVVSRPFKKGRQPHRRKRWRTPPASRLFNQDVLEGYVTWEDDEHEEFVPTVLIIGSTFGHRVFGSDWTLDARSRWNDKRLWEWHHSKMTALMQPSARGGFDQRRALTARGGRNLALHEVDGLYFVSSGGNHRVAAAHQKGIACLRASVLHGRWKPGTPLEIKRWFEKTRHLLLEGQPLNRRFSQYNSRRLGRRA
jgi:hypothetical protein